MTQHPVAVMGLSIVTLIALTNLLFGSDLFLTGALMAVGGMMLSLMRPLPKVPPREEPWRDVAELLPGVDDEAYWRILAGRQWHVVRAAEAAGDPAYIAAQRALYERYRAEAAARSIDKPDHDA